MQEEKKGGKTKSKINYYRVPLITSEANYNVFVKMHGMWKKKSRYNN